MFLQSLRAHERGLPLFEAGHRFRFGVIGDVEAKPSVVSMGSCVAGLSVKYSVYVRDSFRFAAVPKAFEITFTHLHEEGRSGRRWACAHNERAGSRQVLPVVRTDDDACSQSGELSWKRSDRKSVV